MLAGPAGGDAGEVVHVGFEDEQAAGRDARPELQEEGRQVHVDGELVLGAAANGGPGPLVSHFTAITGQLPCPLYVVPGGMNEADMERLS